VFTFHRGIDIGDELLEPPLNIRTDQPELFALRGGSVGAALQCCVAHEYRTQQHTLSHREQHLFTFGELRCYCGHSVISIDHASAKYISRDQPHHENRGEPEEEDAPNRRAAMAR
jgi:hypothetical protein